MFQLGYCGILSSQSKDLSNCSFHGGWCGWPHFHFSFYCCLAFSFWSCGYINWFHLSHFSACKTIMWGKIILSFFHSFKKAFVSRLIKPPSWFGVRSIKGNRLYWTRLHSHSKTLGCYKHSFFNSRPFIKAKLIDYVYFLREDLLSKLLKTSTAYILALLLTPDQGDATGNIDVALPYLAYTHTLCPSFEGKEKKMACGNSHGRLTLENQ